MFAVDSDRRDRQVVNSAGWLGSNERQPYPTHGIVRFWKYWAQVLNRSAQVKMGGGIGGERIIVTSLQWVHIVLEGPRHVHVTRQNYCQVH